MTIPIKMIANKERIVDVRIINVLKFCFGVLVGVLTSGGRVVMGFSSGKISLLHSSRSEQHVMLVPWNCADLPALHYKVEGRQVEKDEMH